MLPLLVAIALSTLSASESALAGASTTAGPTLNGRPLPAERSDAYTVLFVGHPYGHFRDRMRDLPSRNLLANIEPLNELGPHFIALLGDNIGRATASAAQGLRQAFAARIEAPVLAIPGEHDLLAGPARYEKLMGPRFQRLDLGRELFILLDTGGKDGSTELTGDQLAFFEESMDLAERNARIRNIIVLTHKVIWVRHPRYAELSKRINNDRKGGFWDRIYPRLRRLAATRHVVIGAGDVGHKSYSFVLDENPDDGITYFATGLADRDTDSIVRMDFAADGSVVVAAISLTDQPIRPRATALEDFAAGKLHEPSDPKHPEAHPPAHEETTT